MGKAQHKLYRFARVYEKIVANNKVEDLKLLIPMAYKTFKILGDIKSSRSHTRSIEIIKFDESDLYKKNKLMVKPTLIFTDAVARLIADKMKENISHIVVEKEESSNIIKIIY